MCSILADFCSTIHRNNDYIGQLHFTALTNVHFNQSSEKLLLHEDERSVYTVEVFRACFLKVNTLSFISGEFRKHPQQGACEISWPLSVGIVRVLSILILLLRRHLKRFEVVLFNLKYSLYVQVNRLCHKT